MFKVRHNDAIKDATPYARHDGIIKPVKEIWVRYNDAIQRVWQSLSVTISGNFSAEPVGSNRWQDRAVLSISRSPTTAPAPTAYAWVVEDVTGGLMPSSLSGSTLTLTGQQYEPLQFNTIATCFVYCDVTIGGQVYRTPTRTLMYTLPGGI